MSPIAIIFLCIASFAAGVFLTSLTWLLYRRAVAASE